MKLSARSMTEEDSQEVTKLLYMIGDFERISDHAVNIVDSAEEIKDKELQFSEKAVSELSVMYNAINEIIQITEEAFIKQDEKKAFEDEKLALEREKAQLAEDKRAFAATNRQVMDSMAAQQAKFEHEELRLKAWNEELERRSAELNAAQARVPQQPAYPTAPAYPPYSGCSLRLCILRGERSRN